MLFNYRALDQTGKETTGSIDALNVDVAISALQRRGFIITSITETGVSWMSKFDINIFAGVSNKDIVILSRQMATLFQAQISALRIFRLLGEEAGNKVLGKRLIEVSDDLQGGSSISKALAKHPDVFSEFYVNMIRSGEETGKLDQTFQYLADYLDRTYEVSSKAKNALIYPAFVVFTFGAVMILMLVVVIPKLAAIIKDSGQAVPIYTQVVMAASSFLVNYGLFFAGALVVLAVVLIRFFMTAAGKLYMDEIKITVPYVGDLFSKLYLGRIADNFGTMLSSGIPMVKVIDATASVVDNVVYRNILTATSDAVKTGSTLSDALGRYPQIPSIMIQMIKVGEESGQVSEILQTLAKFYNREVNNAVDTLVDLIEPVMIVMLGLGVGVLLTSVLIPIYNISSGVS
jgi:type IV pilus assembly protein PilC